MASPGTGSQPKYQRIADDLKQAIRTGVYGPGDRLPGENDLMATYEVARMTARQALGVLQSEGLTEARKGAGVFVRSFRPLRRRGIQRLAEDTWSTGRSPWSADDDGRTVTVDRISVEQQPAPEPVAHVLGLDERAAVWVRKRRYTLDGKPVLIASSYLPATLVADSPITQEDTGPGGIYARLAELGHKPVHFREEIRSRMPSRNESEQLELAMGTPVILVRRTAFTADGRAVEVNDMTLDSASYVLEYDFGE